MPAGKKYSLNDLIRRKQPPVPWEDGEKIPWNEPDFSQRMLKEHLSQLHDAASRRYDVIDQQVSWIHKKLLGTRPTRILDLGCGPGLYASRLAVLGHTCFGIDFSPASIAYAQEQAAAHTLDCTYTLQDIREAPFGEGFGLVMLLFGEFNVFKRQDAAAILRKAYDALIPGGWLLLEPHPYAVVQSIGSQPPTWQTHAQGLFSEKPHVYLYESYWDGAAETAIGRYVIVDAETAEATVYADTMQAYTAEGYEGLLTQAGFRSVESYPSMDVSEDRIQKELFVLTARKAPAG